MNYCTNCGNKLKTDMEFCSNCGKKVSNQGKDNITIGDDKNPTQQNENYKPSFENGNNTKADSNDLSFMDKVTNEIMMENETDPEKIPDAQDNTKILHIISWIFFVFSFFTYLEIIASIIGYYSARTAMKSGVNANVAR